MESIEIRGYKSIKDLKLNLLPINILIGANGAGKSNILSFFEFLDRLYNQKLQGYVGRKGGIRKFIFNSNELVDSINAKITFDDQINSYSFEIIPSNTNFLIANETLWYYNDKYVYNRFNKEAEVKFDSSYRAKYIKKNITDLKKYHFHDTGEKSPFNQPSKIGKDSLELYDKGENLSAFLYHIKTHYFKVYNRIIKTIQSVIPYFSNFVLVPDSQNNVVLYWQDKNSNYNYDINDFSDGSIRFIALVVLFLQPNPPRTIIIDEPELGLHPFAIAKLAGLIKSVVSNTCQVIVATQSADLIAHFEPNDIMAVDNINGETKIERLDNEKYKGWLEEYTIDELWKRNIINKAQPNF
jgi:predicted ATPase